MLPIRLLLLCIALLASVCEYVYYFPAIIIGQHPTTLTVPIPFRAWQGIAVDNDNIYLLTDRDEQFNLENIITTLSHTGQPIAEYRHAYTGTDSSGRFMSFGDGNVIGNLLYITAYNINGGGPPPYEARVLVYDLPDLKLIKEYDISPGVAESVTQHNGSFWVAYHDRMELCQFNNHFEPLGCLTLSEPRGPHGGYQGAYWKGDCIFLQMHGPNAQGLEPAKGLDEYCLTDTGLEFKGTHTPLSYGTGQGMALHRGKLYQNDRPGNCVRMRVDSG